MTKKLKLGLKKNLKKPFPKPCSIKISIKNIVRKIKYKKQTKIPLANINHQIKGPLIDKICKTYMKTRIKKKN